jgi:hypothetical protein
MGLIGTGSAFVVAATADLAGNSRTRPFTRGGFALVALGDMGLTLGGLASFGADVAGVIA